MFKRFFSEESSAPLVSIVAGIALVLLVIGFVMFMSRDYVSRDAGAPVIPNSPEEVVWKTYESDRFDFSIEYPAHWIVYENERAALPVISFYEKRRTMDPFPPMNGNATHVSIYPRGDDTDGFAGEAVAGTVKTAVEESSNQDFVLTSGEPWATIIRFANQPTSWGTHGYMWAGVTVTDQNFVCERAGAVIAMDACNIRAGDALLTSGTIDAEDRAIEEHMISTFTFTK